MLRFGCTRIAVVAVALAVSADIGLARDNSGQQQCPTLDHGAIESLLRRAPTCRRAAGLFEICQLGSSGDISLGALVTQKCEADFLVKLDLAQRRTYDRQKKRCARKYQSEAGTMYHSFEAFCGADLARRYSARFLGRP